jgi:DNA-binding Lrp family transcriptional regulator
MEKDKIILSLLRENGRMKLTNMSRKTRIPVSTLHERIKGYRGSLIKKHTALVDFRKLGYNARARVLLKVNRAEKEKVREFLKNSPCTNELMKVNNGFDFMAEFVFDSMKSLEEYLDALSERFVLESFQTYYIIDEIKEEDFLSHYGYEKLGKGIGN